jgi:hypothetical protein
MATVQSPIGVIGSDASRHRPRPVAALAVLSVVIALAGCGSSPPRTPLVLAPEQTGPPGTLDPGVDATFPQPGLSTDGPAVATVNGVPITRQEWVDRVQLIRFRFDRERARIQAAIEAGTVDQADAQDQLLELASRAADAQSVAVDDLIDLAFEGRLARDQALSVTPAEVDAAQAAETKDDPTLLADMAKTVSQAAYRRNLEAETVAAKLKDAIIRKATADSGEQVHLSEIYLQSVNGPDSSGDAGAIRTSQIMYAPNDDPDAAPDLALDDPAWAKAQSDAQAAADSLRAIADVKQRSDKFAEAARTTSDDQDTAPDGGDLGWLSPEALEDAQAAALFDQGHQPGEIIGPIRTEIGWVVDLYVERQAPLSERVAKVQQRLAAPSPDFAAVAREESDGEEADAGGDLGWVAPFEVDPQLTAAVKGVAVGQIIGPLTLDDGVHFYRVEGRESRSLSPDQRQQLQDSAFDSWYGQQRDAAEADGRIQIPETSP